MANVTYGERRRARLSLNHEKTLVVYLGIAENLTMAGEAVKRGVVR